MTIPDTARQKPPVVMPRIEGTAPATREKAASRASREAAALAAPHRANRMPHRPASSDTTPPATVVQAKTMRTRETSAS